MVATQKINLLVIVGPTASGKSKLAMRLAQKFNGEIIAADSRTIYKGMDIGTAKPSVKDLAAVPHWGIDIIKPGKKFSAAQFKSYALAAIKDIRSRGKLPIIVGGTGLYVDSVLFNYGFVDSQQLDSSLQKKSIEQLQQMIRRRGYPVPENDTNKLHLIRTIERGGRQGTKRARPLTGAYIVGLQPNDKILKSNISKRADAMFKGGVIDETSMLLREFGPTVFSNSAGLIYKACLPQLAGRYSAEETKDVFKKLDWQYARRQKTWFKKNKFIQWHESPESAFQSVSEILNNTSSIATP
jgi:tRNA dimethylallyltransferase